MFSFALFSVDHSWWSVMLTKGFSATGTKSEIRLFYDDRGRQVFDAALRAGLYRTQKSWQYVLHGLRLPGALFDCPYERKVRPLFSIPNLVFLIVDKTL